MQVFWIIFLSCFCVLSFSWDCYFSLSCSLCLWSVFWHFPWQATVLFGISRECIPTNLAAEIILVLIVHFPEEQWNCARGGSCVLLPPGPAGRLCASWRDTKTGLKPWHWCLPQPLERGIPFPSSKQGAAGRVSAQALHQSGRADGSNCTSRSLAECDKMFSQSFWKSGPTCEAEEGEKPQWVRGDLSGNRNHFHVGFIDLCVVCDGREKSGLSQLGVLDEIPCD